MVDISFRYKVALSCIVIMMVFVTLSGFSYAYFTAEVTTAKKTNYSITTEGINLSFTEGTDNINLTNQKPVDDTTGLGFTPHTFTLTNNNSYAVSIKIYLTIDTLGLPANAIKYAFGTTKPAAGALLSSNTSTDATIETSKTSYLLGSIDNLASKGISSKYSLWLWIDSNVGGIVDCSSNGTCAAGTTMGQTFKAHISIRAEQHRDPISQSQTISDEGVTEGPQIFDDPSEIAGNNTEGIAPEVSTPEAVIPEATEPEITEPEIVAPTESEVPENSAPVVEEPSIEDIPQNGEGMEGPSIG